MPIIPGTRIGMIGDSIVQQGLPGNTTFKVSRPFLVQMPAPSF
ncbi:MAG: hypothetical protein ACRCTG_15415 [Aestuariivirga sp.]